METAGASMAPLGCQGKFLAQQSRSHPGITLTPPEQGESPCAAAHPTLTLTQQVSSPALAQLSRSTLRALDPSGILFMAQKQRKCSRWCL